MNETTNTEPETRRAAYNRWERETFGNTDSVHRDRARFDFENAENARRLTERLLAGAVRSC